MNLAIVVIAYKRIDSLFRLLKSLQNANYLGHSIPLIISIDKSDSDEVIKLAKSFIWEHGEKIIKLQNQNLGLREHILSQGDEFDKYDAIIVLEDDIIVSPIFYQYSYQVIQKYYDNTNIAGISLYSFPINYLTNLPFEAYKDGNDIFFMKTAQSWGQVWMKNQWKEFKKWYDINKDFTFSDEIPYTLFNWSKSWLKYHTRFCIECDKWFVYPYHSLSSNCGEIGVHSSYQSYNNFQTNMLMSISRQFVLPDSITKGIRYDAFFENEVLYEYLNLNPSDLCIDLSGYRKTYTKRYILTTKILPYQILKSFSLKRHPIECNIIFAESGQDIFLYDSNIKCKCRKLNNPIDIISYSFRFNSLYSLIRMYGFKSTMNIVFINLKHSLKHLIIK